MVLTVQFPAQQSQHLPGTVDVQIPKSSPRPTKSETGLGPSHLSFKALQVILMQVRVENQRTKGRDEEKEHQDKSVNYII